MHDFGVVDIENEVEMEKVLMWLRIVEMDEGRILKRIAIPMMEMEVPGFCSEIKKLLEKYDVDVDGLKTVSDKRQWMKRKIQEYQKQKLLKEMMFGSKTDNMLLHFDYDGKMKRYIRG